MSLHENRRFWQIPRVRLQNKIRTNSDVSTEITVSSAKSQKEKISIVKDTGGDEILTTPQTQSGFQQHSLPVDTIEAINVENVQVRRGEMFQGPANLYSLVPVLGKQRCALNVIKFPSLISIVIGCVLEWGQFEYFPDLFRALAIISIVSGVYSLLITWIVCGQSNFQHTPGDTSLVLNLKLVQTCGSAVFAGVQIALALVTILQIDGIIVAPDQTVVNSRPNYAMVNEKVIKTVAPTAPPTTLATTTTTTETPMYSTSNVLAMAYALILSGVWIVCLATIAMVYAAKAKTELRKELEFRKNRNLAFANALNFSFGKRLRAHIV